MQKLQGNKGKAERGKRKGESGKLKAERGKRKGFKHVHYAKPLYSLDEEVIIDYLRTEPGTKSKEQRTKTIECSFQITAISQKTDN